MTPVIAVTTALARRPTLVRKSRSRTILLMRVHRWAGIATTPRGPSRSRSADSIPFVRSQRPRLRPASSSWKTTSRCFRIDGSTAITSARDRGDQQHQRDGPRHEDRWIALRDDQGTAEVLLQQRTEDEAQQERRWLASQLHEDVAEEREERDREHIEWVLVQ